ncbi:MAG: sensor histidine kinase [Actinobacteria bacterium]|nr:sensor histidine kinase [Actinomycetota bacterium]
MAHRGDPVTGWNLTRARIDQRVFDAVLAVATLTIALASTAQNPTDAQHPTEANALAYGLTTIAFGSLVLRRRRPFVVFAICIGTTAVFAALDYPENGLPVACLIATYTVASLGSRRSTATAAGIVLAVIVGLTIRGSQGLTLGSAAGNIAMFGVAFASGAYMRVRRAYLAELELRAEATDENRRLAAEQAVAEERLRIARELHDVVAHSMSVVAVQSGVAAHVIDGDPAQARTMLTTINGTSRQALAEMRRLLGVLRADGDEPEASRAPAPSLADVPTLVASMAGTGVAVDLDVEGEPRPDAPGVELAAFRVVQEALTNVVRHAGPAQVEVRVRYEPDQVRIDVVDDGRGAASEAVAPDEGGHGLVGMRERVDLYGGQLRAGPRPGGGFAVSATLPYDHEPVVA